MVNRFRWDQTAGRRPRCCSPGPRAGVGCGGTVNRAPELLHGKTARVLHDGTGVLQGWPSPVVATRYHSLTIDPTTVTD